MKKQNMIDDAGEVRELSAEDIQAFKTFASLPEALQTKLRKGRGANKAPTKEHINIRLSSEVLSHFRATGAGWQSRMDSVLIDWVSNHK